MGLTEMQADFLDRFLDSVESGKPNAYQAAKQAGYAESTAKNAGQDILESPRVRAELDRRLGEVERHGEFTIKRAIPVALTALIEIARNGRDDRARVNAAREILDRTSLIRREGKDVKGDFSADAIARIQNLLTSALKETLTPEQAVRVAKFIKEKLCAESE